MSRIERALEKATKMRDEKKKEKKSEFLAKEDTKGAITPGPEKIVQLHVSRRSLFVIAAVIILISVTTGVTMLSQKRERRNVKDTPQAQISTLSMGDRPQSVNTETVLDSSYAIEVARLDDSLLKDLSASSGLTYREASENEFYSVSVKARNGCIPEDIAKSLYREVSIIKGKKLMRPSEIEALDSMQKFIYKLRACGKKSGIVYVRFFVACRMEIKPEGLLVGGRKVLL